MARRGVKGHPTEHWLVSARELIALLARFLQQDLVRRGGSEEDVLNGAWRVGGEEQGGAVAYRGNPHSTGMVYMRCVRRTMARRRGGMHRCQQREEVGLVGSTTMHTTAWLS